ncbi:MAG: flagellar basal body rod protein FlgC [Proteobacteria bacterium]|nr:flagellar basal body rod protein FlgC [Pseudomonadota bacterium]
MDLFKALRISAAGMKAQGVRLRVIAENMANADSVAPEPGGEPYRRKVITFKNVLDRTFGVRKVEISKITVDRSDFKTKYDPTHPSADADGYVLTPNVNTMIEMMDMREAQRSYSANLNVIEASKTMLMRTIDILRA